MYSQVTLPPVTPPSVTLSGASPSPPNSPPNSLLAAGADPRSRYLAEALANLRDQAKTIRTPMAFASDLLAEALLQRRSSPPRGGRAGGLDLAPEGAPAYAPQGQPGPLQVAPAPQAAPVPSPSPSLSPSSPSPSPGVPPPSAPGGTASAAPAASSPAAGAAVAPPGAGGAAAGPAALGPPAPLQAAAQAGAKGASPTLVDALKAWFAAKAPAQGGRDAS